MLSRKSNVLSKRLFFITRKRLDLILLNFLITILPFPKFLGDWESLTYYSTFASKSASFDLSVPPRANVGGQGYWVLDLSRNLIEMLNLPLNFFWLRLPSILLGIISTTLCYLICRKFLNHSSSLVITSLIATNPTHYFFQHTLTINIASFAFLLLLIHQILILYENMNSSRQFFYVGLSLALVYTTYGPAKLFATFFIAYLFVTMKSFLVIPKVNYIYAILPSLILIIAQQYWKYENLKNLYFSKDAEILISQRSDTIETLRLNLKILLDTVILKSVNGDSPNIFSMMVGGRYPLTNSIPMAILLGLSLILLTLHCLKQNQDGKKLRKLLLLTLLLSTSIVISSSSFRPSANENILASTVSNFRMIFLLIPYLFLNIFLVKRLSGSQFRLIIFGVMIIALLINTRTILKDVGTFNNLTPNAINISSTQSDLINLASQLGIDNLLTENTQHFIQHSNYIISSKHISQKLSAIEPEVRYVVYINTSCFSDPPLRQKNYGNLNDYNFHSFFQYLYLSDSLDREKVLGIVVPYTDYPTYIDGKYGFFPPKLISMGQGLKYVNGHTKKDWALRVFPDDETPNIIITTTWEEFQTAMNYENLHMLKVKLILDKVPCGSSLVRQIHDVR